jgi:hypothetical protein
MAHSLHYRLYDQGRRSGKVSRSDAMGDMDLREAAILYGCQTNQIRDFIARGMLHTPLGKQEVEELRQKHLHKQINSRANPRRKRR